MTTDLCSKKMSKPRRANEARQPTTTRPVTLEERINLGELGKKEKWLKLEREELRLRTHWDGTYGRQYEKGEEGIQSNGKANACRTIRGLGGRRRAKFWYGKLM